MIDPRPLRNLKPEDRPEPPAADVVPWRPRPIADPHATLTDLLAGLRALDGATVQLREMAGECAARNDPAILRLRIQSRVLEAAEDVSAALDLAERLARELRQRGAFSASYDGGTR